jgi:5-methylcytosine-specific restriction endonuclease McrA
LRCKQEYLENKAKHKEYGKTHYQKNRAEYLASNRYRKALLKQRVPSWLTDSDKKAIVEIYKEARRLTETTGIRHHVDHIVPLQGKTVSGFHVPWNLQILTAEENLRKNNKHEPDDFSASF